MIQNIKVLKSSNRSLLPLSPGAKKYYASAGKPHLVQQVGGGMKEIFLSELAPRRPYHGTDGDSDSSSAKLPPLRNPSINSSASTTGIMSFFAREAGCRYDQHGIKITHGGGTIKTHKITFVDEIPGKGILAEQRMVESYKQYNLEVSVPKKGKKRTCACNIF